jgi:aspartate racemase
LRLDFKPIGILGGMGPQATILLQQRILDAVSADDDNAHIPLMIDMNPQIPSRLDYLLDGGEVDPAPTIIKMAKRLEIMGAKALAMPCNTAHHFAPQICDAVKIPLLHMVDEAVQNALDLVPNRMQKIGILASPATDDINLFHEAFAPYEVECIYPTIRDEMLSSIRNIKANGVQKVDKETLIAGAINCKNQGAEALIIGCSEFSLIADVVQNILPSLDTLDTLVEEMVRFSIEPKT